MINAGQVMVNMMGEKRWQFVLGMSSGICVLIGVLLWGKITWLAFLFLLNAVFVFGKGIGNGK